MFLFLSTLWPKSLIKTALKFKFSIDKNRAKIKNVFLQLYHLSFDCDIASFLVPLGNGKVIGNPLGKEALVIRERPGDIEVGLYIDPKTMQKTCWNRS